MELTVGEFDWPGFGRRQQLPVSSVAAAAGTAPAIITVVNGLGSKLNTKFASINATLK